METASEAVLPPTFQPRENTSLYGDRHPCSLLSLSSALNCMSSSPCLLWQQTFVQRPGPRYQSGRELLQQKLYVKCWNMCRRLYGAVEMLQLEDGWESRGCAGWGGTGKMPLFGSNPADVCSKWTYSHPPSVRTSIAHNRDGFYLHLALAACD